MLNEELPPHEQYVVDVLLKCAPGGSVPKDRMNVTPTPGGVAPCPSGTNGVALVVPVMLSTINGISHLRIVLPRDLRPEAARQTAWKSVLEVHRRFPDGVPLLDPIHNMGIKDEKFQLLVTVRLLMLCWIDLRWLVTENWRHGREALFESFT